MEPVEFKSDGLKIQGNLFFPRTLKNKNPAILFIHGWTSEMKRSFQYAETLAKLGYISLLFDMRGHGISEGSLDSASRKEFLSDVLAAYDYLAKTEGVDTQDISVVGSSFGGYLATLLTTKRRVKRIALRVPADYPNEGFDLPHISQTAGDESVMEWRNRPRKPHETFAINALGSFNGDVLIIEAEKDDRVPHEVIKSYISVVKNQGTLTHIVMKNAPHSAREPKFIAEIEQNLADWFNHEKISS